MIDKVMCRHRFLMSLIATLCISGDGLQEVECLSNDATGSEVQLAKVLYLPGHI